MSDVNYRVAFPCGLVYDLEININRQFFGFYKADIKIPDVDELICPIHGDKCKAK